MTKEIAAVFPICATVFLCTCVRYLCWVLVEQQKGEINFKGFEESEEEGDDDARA